MARIRTLKPGFFTSGSLAKCSIPAMVTFEGMWTEADDCGRGRADARLLKGAIWPLRDEITAHDVHDHLVELVETGHIRLYIVDEEPYYEVIKWDEHQAALFRRGGPVHPLPPASTSNSNEPFQSETNGNSSLPLSREQGTGNREQGTGNREQGTGNTRTAPADAAASACMFAEFWDAYPHKAAKPAARRAFEAAKASQDELMAGVRAWAAYWRTEAVPQQFVPYPQKFLTQRKWEDEPPTPKARDRPVVSFRQRAVDRAIAVAGDGARAVGAK